MHFCYAGSLQLEFCTVQSLLDTEQKYPCCTRFYMYLVEAFASRTNLLCIKNCVKKVVKLTIKVDSTDMQFRDT